MTDDRRLTVGTEMGSSLLPGPRATLGLLLLALVMVALAIFVVQNFAVVEIDFLRWQFEIRLGWAILIAAAVGFVLAVILGWHRGRRG
jgi:uncharacterized integral membrane protein